MAFLDWMRYERSGTQFSMTSILAIASGKGGVGKTLTAVNIALCAARDKIRTALVDADPLSNVMTLLDYPFPQGDISSLLDNPETWKFVAAPSLHVFFPQTKKSPSAADNLINTLLTRHGEWIKTRYDLVIIDMPAGIRDEENSFPYLSLIDGLLLVTNPEPTAHVAAGAFLKSLEPVLKTLKFPVWFWHNMYESYPDENFNADDVLGNYNRNVNATARLSIPNPEVLTRVPPDRALDLTRADPDIQQSLIRSFSSTLRAIRDAVLPLPLKADGAGLRAGILISRLFRETSGDEDSAKSLKRLREILGDSPEIQPILPSLMTWFRQVNQSPLRRQIRKTERVIEQIAEGTANFPGKNVDREIVILLKMLDGHRISVMARRLSCLLLFQYTILKILTNQTAMRLILSFLPRRTEGGISIRDRRRQISRLIVKESHYQKRYFVMIKKVYPLVSRQLDLLVSSFKLQSLLFKQKDGTTARHIYVKLFSTAVYELVNSGLGIISGFRFRPSSRSFRTGYDELVNRLKIKKTSISHSSASRKGKK